MREAAKQQGRTVLYVSHNMNTIRQLCDRCIVLDKGKVIFSGGVEEAIGVYMNNSKSLSTSIDFSKYKRPRWITNQKLKLLTAEYLNKENTLFDAKENIILHLNWINLDDLHDVGLRIEIWTLDDVTQASYILYDFYSGKQGEKGDVVLELDISNFREASYKMVYCFFCKDSFGNDQDIDCAFGLCFDKIMMNEENKILWKVKNWGHLQMPAPKIISKR